MAAAGSIAVNDYIPTGDTPDLTEIVHVARASGRMARSTHEGVSCLRPT
jgi:hypothetical protein